NDEILTRWNLEKILTNRVRGIDSNPALAIAPLRNMFPKIKQPIIKDAAPPPFFFLIANFNLFSLQLVNIPISPYRKMNVHVL
ncbi:hypothetical protein, partial [Enterococcus faecium]|uniref:hypothetical protein n=1 Tax=Enterococcus faecium TaxID=1352 RepID=UPI003F43BDDD